MAGRREYSAREAVELVTQDGSDIEDDLLGADSDYTDDSSDWFVPSTDFDSDRSDNTSETDPYNVDSEISEIDTDIDSDMAEHDRDRGDAMFADSDDDDEWMYDWCKDLRNFPMNAPFSGNSALCLPDDFPATPTPADFYQLIVDSDLITLLKTETNRYARVTCTQKKAKGGLNPRSVYNIWTPVTLEEMRRFVAILIHMGLVKKTKITDYWSTDPSVHSKFASRLLKRERFRAILAFFHLNDNSLYIPRGQDGHDPLFKLRPFFDHLFLKFSTLYTPEEQISIDEAMCPWRGRVVFRVRDKPVKWGIKLYELCESSSGYVCNMEVMCHSPGVSNTPFDVCMRLLDPLKNLGHTVYVDNYYCNPALAETLAAENTQVVGTVRSNCVGLPKDLVQQSMAQGDVDYRRKKQVLFLRWKDKRDVYMLTTKHLPQMKTVQSRTERKEKPVCVVDYVQNMAGVDKSDQMISYLPLHRKTIKWWKKLALHLLTLAMIQSHILYNKHRQLHNRQTTQLDMFVKSVCKNFTSVPVTEDPQPSTSGAAATDVGAEMGRLQPGNHWPAHIPSPNVQTTRKTQRGCKVCYAKKKATGASRDVLRKTIKTTTFRCKQCLVPLCDVPCFEIFHTKKDYTK